MYYREREYQKEYLGGLSYARAEKKGKEVLQQKKVVSQQPATVFLTDTDIKCKGGKIENADSNMR